MSENKIYSFIGLAKKAGAVAAGEFTVENALKHGKAFLVVIAEDASQNTVKKFTEICAGKNVRTTRFGTKSELGGILGREMYSVVAITDRRFSGRIDEMIGSSGDSIKTDNKDSTVNG